MTSPSIRTNQTVDQCSPSTGPTVRNSSVLRSPSSSGDHAGAACNRNSDSSQGNHLILDLGSSVISIAVLILAAMIFAPQGVKFEHYSQLPTLLVPVFGYWGYWLIVASVGISCLGAAMEITLELAYLTAQGFGWNWSENPHPRREARFCCTYTVMLVLGGIAMLCAPDPLKLVNAAMVLTAATLPVAIVPFLFVMNDPRYVKEHGNGRISNYVVVFAIVLAFVLALVSVPLDVIGGG